MTEVPSQEEFAAKLKYAAVVEPPIETDWPTMSQVERDYPQLCGEEQVWILESLIAEAHRRKNNEKNGRV